MKVIAIEEHFITPMYREKVGANEFRNFYLQSRSEQIGHDIVEQNSDLGTSPPSIARWLRWESTISCSRWTGRTSPTPRAWRS